MKIRQWQPHLIAIAIFFVVSSLYCLPAFKGLIIDQHDTQGWKGMAQQSIEYKEKYGHYPLWTNSTFSGMPAFQILGENNYVSLAVLDPVLTLFLPKPASLFFLCCISFYILCTSIPFMRSRMIFIRCFKNLLPFSEWRQIISEAGFNPSFQPGFWDTHYKASWKNIMGRLLNNMGDINPAVAMTSAPFIYIIAKPVSHHE